MQRGGQVSRDLEYAAAEERHELLNELGKLRKDQQSLDDVRGEVIEVINTLRHNNHMDAGKFDDVYNNEWHQHGSTTRIRITGSLPQCASRVHRVSRESQTETAKFLCRSKT